MLVERNRVGAQSGRMRQLPQIFADRGIARARGTEMRGEEFIPLLFVGGKLRAEFVEPRIVRPVGFFHQLQAFYFLRRDSRSLIELVVDAQKYDVQPQDDYEAPADDCFALLNN